jgi:hypothetical protein
MDMPGYTSNKRQLILELRQAQLEGMKKTGKKIVNGAKRRVRKKSHALEKSIEMKGQPKRGPNGYTLEIGSNKPYAGVQERGFKDGRNYGFTPYLGPAYDAEAPGLAADIKEILDIL